MTPTFHPRLVNGRFGDPALFVEMLHRREALLFDIGDVSALSARDLLRVTHVFVTHMHVDHFVGFDALLRVSIGRAKTIRVVGPQGLCERLHHKLQGYEWDLVDRYEADLRFEAVDVGQDGPLRAATFRFKRRFVWEDAELPHSGPVAVGEGFQVEAALLEHHGPCLGFALTEPAHANVWKSRLQERGLRPGPWLQPLKAAVLRKAPDHQPIAMDDGSSVPLGELRDVLALSPGQKIAYVADVADTRSNRTAIARLSAGADTLFLEARFAVEHAEQASERAHLTTRAAGEIARAARVRRFEPFHFSPRYEGEEERLIEEASSFFGDEVALAERSGA